MFSKNDEEYDDRICKECFEQVGIWQVFPLDAGYRETDCLEICDTCLFMVLQKLEQAKTLYIFERSPGMNTKVKRLN